MNAARCRQVAAVATVLAFAPLAGCWHQRDADPHFLSSSPQQFAAQFATPPAPESATTRAELDELLALQASRTSSQVRAARADRKTRIERFYGALGIDVDAPPPLPRLRQLAERVEDDVRIHVRAVKYRYLRLRPQEIEPRIAPCIRNVRADQSYPSGHAAYGYAMAYLLERLVPERRMELEARAAEFAQQRMICGVHFRSDLDAGRLAARQLLSEMRQSPAFRAEESVAADELRAALRATPVD
jgi:acid phosphatase (class A)